MWKSYLTIAWRTIAKHKIYAFINIFGLTIGLSAALLLLLYVRDELTFDHFHSKGDRIMRLVNTRHYENREPLKHLFTPAPLGPALKEAYPEVEEIARVVSWASFPIKRQLIERKESHHYFADPSIFNVLDLPLQAGDPETALAQPKSVVLTPEAAQFFFGQEDPMGQTLEVGPLGPVKVTGILKPLPHNTHFNISMLFPFEALHAIEGLSGWLSNWERAPTVLYVLTREPPNTAVWDQRLLALMEQHWDSEMLSKNEGHFQMLKDIHFNSEGIWENRPEKRGNIQQVTLLSLVAIFILVIACINYMNLATARSLIRAKEVGMRKVVGASRKQLAFQFISESLVFTAMGFMIAMALVELLLPAFNSLVQKQLTLQNMFQPAFFAMSLAMVLLVGLISGSYPAFYLSALNPVTVLKGKHKSGRGAVFFRQALVTVQFCLSLVLIIGTLVAFHQINYIQSRDMGYRYENLLVIDIDSGAVRQATANIVARLNKHPDITVATTSSRVPADWKQIREITTQYRDSGPVHTHYLGIDEHFLDTFEIKLASGRNFSADRVNDQNGLLLNKAAVAAYGLDNPIGTKIEVPDSEFVGEVIGVLEDFHFQSLHHSIGPMVLGHWTAPMDNVDYFTARPKPGREFEATKAAHALLKEIDPGTPVVSNFLEFKIEEMYQTDRMAGKLIAIAAAMAIVIACLGLWGLAAFTAGRRTKEIGVRKALGAETRQIVLLLTKDISKPIVVAMAIAFPIAYLAVDYWLAQFAYRVPISALVFVIAGFTALLIGWSTSAYHALKAAFSNPVSALRYE